MKRRVVDASVGAKWILPEVYTENALRLLSEDIEFLVPDLFYIEIANILWQRVRRREISKDDADDHYRDIANTDLKTYPSESLANAALDMACETGQTAYDCLYVALALREGVPLITADRPLYDGLLPYPAYAAHTVWIADV